ncbi:CPBP family intramembrane glutamic endopeptidase [Amycolatopsis sp. H20-H5]|uniref:CPBP family intramembrane glutamic endopeptidase n=1 Tax=Amycolatopsis sp. H20-H5 TaxID=3046309 RepID=UPI002DB57747|nr:type II CAAX endopeptidase family protein [Amycolatopsis sp. H20-H5]MEC3981646.1 type II CAAX endopeptidase family protein [Amycolatopsis sp. H20-H5]
MGRARRRWRARADRLVDALPASWTAGPVKDNTDSETVLAHRRRVVGGVTVAGAGLLGVSLSTKPGSAQFYRLTSGVAATWVAGGLASGPLHLGWTRRRDEPLRRPLVTPVLIGVGAFGVFYACALVSRRIPVLNRAISGILRYAHQGSPRSVLLTTLANGAAEEVFFRGAVFAAASGRGPVRISTAVYALTTVATRNPALVLASIVMGSLFGLQRRATGGIQAPLLTHLVWSALMVRYLPPLFAPAEPARPEPKE